MTVLESHGFTVDRATIVATIRNPDKTESGYGGREIRQKRLSSSHVLRVVCEVSEDMITVVTMYPGRRERYEKD